MAKQSGLVEFHKMHGAAFFETEGWFLPKTFGNTASEYQAVRGSVGLIDIGHREMFQFTGPDRVSFLQGMLSNDVRALNMFDGQRAAILTQQGKIIADVRVLCGMHSLYIDFWEPLKEKILAHLNHYLVADEVEIIDPSPNWQMLSIQGPQARPLLEILFKHAALPSKPMQHGMVELNGAPICIVEASRFGEPGYDLIVTRASVTRTAEQLTQLGEEFSASWIGDDAQEILRIEAGVPRYGVDYTDENLVLELGLKDAVSFSKGCYLGQEVVERIRARGHVNRRLSGLLLDGAAPAVSGASILGAEKEVGRITSSVYSPALNKPIALAYIQKDFWNAGTALHVKDGEASRSATVADLPFLAPASGRPSS